MRFSTWRDELRVEFGFSFLDSSVFRDVDALDLKVYVALCRSVWRSEIKGSMELREVAKQIVVAKIGQETLARRVGVSIATVKRSLKRLRESKWVEALQGHRRELYYALGTIVDGREDYYLADIVRRVVDAEVAEGLIPAQESTETPVFGGATSLTDERPGSSNMSGLVAHGRATEEVKVEEEKNEQLPTRLATLVGESSIPSEQVQTPPESVVVEAGDKQKSANGGATKTVPTSVAKALKDNKERVEKLRRGGSMRVEGSLSPKPPKEVGGTTKRRGKTPPDPEVAAAMEVFATTYKQVFGAEFLSGAPQIAQMRSLVKRCSGKERALAICEFVLQKWPELSRRWKWFGHPDLGVILMRAQSVWNEIQTGKGGTSPTQTRDERTEQQQDARNRMYADKDAPIIGFEAFMGTKPASAAPGR